MTATTDSIEQNSDASPAFRQALLKSEKKRIVAVVTFVSFFLLLAIVRIFVFGSGMSRWGLLVGAAVIGLELYLFRLVNRSLQSSSVISSAAWYCTLALESVFPAVGVAFLSSGRLLQDYRPIATPWLLAYFPLILLSVLRLNPKLCCFSGFAAAAGFLTAAYILGWRFSIGTHGYASPPQTVVPYFAFILLATGVLAAAVASEIRSYVGAALREAEVQHQLRQVEHDLQIARSIQQSLLPKVRPQIPGFAVAGWSQSADDTGGDFYDWKKLSDGRWVVFLADVTGHGIGPAILASVCRAYSRASFNQHDSLATTVKHIDQAFSEDLTSEHFATFVAAILQEGCDQVELLSAGQGPLVLYSARNGSFQYMNAQALPLGIAPEMDGATPIKLSMQSGDMVLLVTDGFFEWEDQDCEQYGTKRLADVVRRFKDREPEVIIAELYDSVRRFSQGTPQKDDLTAVLIKRVAESAVV